MKAPPYSGEIPWPSKIPDVVKCDLEVREELREIPGSDLRLVAKIPVRRTLILPDGTVIGDETGDALAA